MPNIRYCTPYAIDKNLAQAYNYEMSLAKPGEYVVFLDGDAQFLLSNYGHIIEAVIKENQGAFITCMTNRINCKWQKQNGITGSNIDEHRLFAKKLFEKYGTTVEDHTDSQLWSGFLMACPKDNWENLTPQKKLLGIDNEIHIRAKDNGHRIKLMRGFLIYHHYGGYDGDNPHQNRNKQHLL